MVGGSTRAREVRTRVHPSQLRRPFAAPEVLPPPDPYEELGQPPIDPGAPSKDVKERIREIYIRYGRRDAVEFARRQVVQMHFAGLSNDQMAEKLGVTVRTIENYKREIRRGHVDKLKNVDPGEMLGEILTHYDYHINMAWQQFLSAKTNEDRRQCQMVCLKAQADKVRFLKEWKLSPRKAGLSNLPGSQYAAVRQPRCSRSSTRICRASFLYPVYPRLHTLHSSAGLGVRGGGGRVESDTITLRPADNGTARLKIRPDGLLVHILRD